MAQAILFWFVVLRLAQLLAERIVSWVNRRFYLDPCRQEEAAERLRIPPEDMGKALAYARDRYRFGLASDSACVAGALIFLALGGLGWVEAWSLSLAPGLAPGPVTVGLVFFAILGLGSAILGLPFALYRTFRLEQKHGFNRQTLGGFFADWLKSLALAAVLGGPLLWAILMLIERTGSGWWVWAWIVVSAFSVLTAWIYPTLLAPLFNTFTPLAEGELKKRIYQLAQRVGFRARGIYVMDASRRTAHGNAYFTGLFGARRIVLFDTLLEALPDDELVAVLAHELGHFKLKHVRWQLVRGVLVTGALLCLLALCLPLRVFYTAFGLQGPSSYGGLVVFGLWFGLLGFLLQPLQNLISRRNEFAADAFAARHGGAPGALAEALLKLRQKSRSLPISHPLFSRVYHSHPPLLERLEALGWP